MTTLNTQVAERYIDVNGEGTVRVSLVKLPASHGGMFESAAFTDNGDSYVWVRNYVLDYAVDAFESLCSTAVLADFIATERQGRLFADDYDSPMATAV